MPDMWERVEALFEATRDMPPEERLAYIEEQTADDPALAREMRELLRHDRPGPLDEPLVMLPDALTDDKAPRRVGPYEIVRELGQGGMGVVYLAQQTEPVQREVALKLVRPGMGSDEIVHRFESERQALALLGHRNVARVLDAGSTEDGRSYFVMEYVPGLPITDYCDAERLSLEQRLRLFVEACQGIRHAHQKGIIHRDIKSSNVLVTTEDGRPMPKIIDFGIARATRGALASDTRVTAIGQLVGTPEFMSPEQADLSEQDVDTRSDIYSLGVLLYELLVGRLPFDAEALRTYGLIELARTIREVDPQTPSSRFTSLGKDARAVADRRGAETTSYARALRHDLDWIVMRAIEKDRDRRYQSVGELIDDIERHLADEPVIARSPSKGYRLRKFVRRHRVGVAAAALIVATIVAGAAGTITSLVRALRAEELAQEEASRAQREAAVAARVTGYMEDVFKAADPDRARGRIITARDLLDEGKRLLEERDDLISNPPVRARFMETIGRSYRTIGAYDEALPLLREALDLRRADPDESNLLGAINLVATVLVSMECYEQALAYLEETVALAERVRGPEHTDTAAALKNLADARSRTGHHDEARAVYERALRIREKVHGPDHVYVAISLAGLAEALSRAGDHDEAIELLRRSLEIRLRNDPEDRSAGWGHYSMAQGLLAAGRTELARDHFEAALAIWEPLLGAEHEHVARVLTGMALTELELGDADRSETLLRRALAIEERAFGAEHPFVAETLENLASVLEEKRSHREATSLRSRAAAIDTPISATCE